MSNTQATLVRMANDIARNLAAMGEEKAALATADHIATFWEPRMRGAILADRAGLSPIAARAIAALADHAPAHQTRATAADAGSDAG